MEGGAKRSLLHFLFDALNGLIRPEMQRKIFHLCDSKLMKIFKYLDFFKGKQIFSKLVHNNVKSFKKIYNTFFMGGKVFKV